jgi:restriction system protein
MPSTKQASSKAAGVTWQRDGELLHALFEVLREHSEGLPASEAIKRVEARVTLTPHEAGFYDNGVRRFDKIIRFGTIASVKAGWLIKDSGRWILTEEGWKAHKQYPDSLGLIRRSIELYNIWKKGQPDQPSQDEPNVEQGAAGAAITLETAEDWARTEIEKHLKSMEPYEFQRLVGGLLSAMGYHVAWIAPPGKDDGVDLIAYSDPLGTRPPRIKVQVKRYKDPVPVGDVSAFMGNLGSEEVGIFVSTGNFTKDAETKVRVDKQHRVTLVGLDALVQLWVRHYEKLDQTAKRRLPLRPIYFLAPEG